MAQILSGERGQAAVEFGLVMSALLVLTVGLVDVGRWFYQSSEVGSLARYGSRWASVVGGTCGLAGRSTSDWCLPSGTTRFWALNGNKPLQGAGVSCPSPNRSATPGTSSNPYYQVSAYSGTTTIVGAIASKWDTTSTSTSLRVGGTAPGLDQSKVWVCIATTNNGAGTQLEPRPGDAVTIDVTYPWAPVSAILPNVLPSEISSSSVYRVE